MALALGSIGVVQLLRMLRQLEERVRLLESGADHSALQMEWLTQQLEMARASVQAYAELRGSNGPPGLPTLAQAEPAHNSSTQFDPPALLPLRFGSSTTVASTYPETFERGRAGASSRSSEAGDGAGYRTAEEETLDDADEAEEISASMPELQQRPGPISVGEEGVGAGAPAPISPEWAVESLGKSMYEIRNAEDSWAEAGEGSGEISPEMGQSSSDAKALPSAARPQGEGEKGATAGGGGGGGGEISGGTAQGAGGAGGKEGSDKGLASRLDSTLSRADVLYDAAKYDEAYSLLADLLEDEEGGALGTGAKAQRAARAEVLWRSARLSRERAEQAKARGEKARAKDLSYSGLEHAMAALEIAPDHFAVHKWYAISLSTTSGYEGTKASITSSVIVKSHFEKAVDLNPKDATSRHLLGLWYFEVASLSWATRKLAGAIFATPPTATYEEALSHLEAAENLSPGFYIKNRLLLAKANLGKGSRAAAGEWARKALQLGAEAERVLSLDDEKSLKEVREVLASL